jgi:predicted amidohydrolase
MKVYCIQFNISWENQPANYGRVRELVKSAAPLPGSLVLLPEMFATGFSMNVPAIGEEDPSATEEFLATLARDHQVFVTGGVTRRRHDGRGLNQAVAFSPAGRILCRYTKMQPFSLGGETAHYEAGEDVQVFPCQDFLVAPFICYDLRFPELFRAAVRRGTQVYAVLANWPSKRAGHWLTLLQARAIENQAFVLGVNRCGSDPNLTYDGQSIIISPTGEILAQAGAEETVLSAQLDVDLLLEWRLHFPALRDAPPG